MIASTCAAFSSTRSARVGAWSGTRCCREDSSNCSTSPRGSSMSMPRIPDRWCRVRRRPNAPPSAARTRRRPARGVRTPARPAVSTRSKTAHTIRVVRIAIGGCVGFLLEVAVGELGDQPDGGAGIVGVGDDHRLARGQRVALELRARGQPAHIAGYREHDVDRAAQPILAAGHRRRGPANRGAQRLQQRDRARVMDIGPWQSGVASSDGIIRGDRLRWRPD